MPEFDFLRQLSEIASTIHTDEEREAIAAELAARLPSSFLTAAKREMLAHQALEDSPAGWRAFYELIHGFPPPTHIMQDIESIFKAHNDGIGCLIFNYRKAWKSVSISVTFVAWRIGLEPRKTHMVVSANDDSAEKVIKAIAAMIEYHPEWKRVFPNVVPDTGRWGVEGYSVVDNTLSPEEWARQQSGVIDPTLVGGGYGSSRLIGKHPTGCLIIDDVHDYKNSSSRVECKMVVEIITKVILKTVIVENDRMTTWLVAVGTPWSDDDAYQEMKRTGQYIFVNIPVMKRMPDGQGTFIDGVNRDGTVFTDIQGYWEITDPAHFGVQSIIRERADGKSAFWLMYMLDLNMSSSGRLKYQQLDCDRIDLAWPMQGGADPTNMKDAINQPGKRSFFALAYVARIPGGGAVVVDGVLKQCTILEAINFIAQAQSRFSGWLTTAVENTGGGSVFIVAVNLANPNIRIVDSDLGDILKRSHTIKSKPDRINLELSPWFENGRILISKADTPFLNALRRLFDKFFDLDPHDEAWDAGDAVYHAVKAMPDVLQVPVDTGALPSTTVEDSSMESPIVGIGNYYGYKR